MSLLPAILPDLAQSTGYWLTGDPTVPHHTLWQHQPVIGTGAVTLVMFSMFGLALLTLGFIFWAITRRPTLGPEHALIAEVQEKLRAEATSAPSPKPWERPADWWRR